jgi:hypothetical protein
MAAASGQKRPREIRKNAAICIIGAIKGLLNRIRRRERIFYFAEQEGCFVERAKCVRE